MTGLYLRSRIWAAILAAGALWIAGAQAQGTPSSQPSVAAASRSHLLDGGQGLALYSGERAIFTLSGSYMMALDRIEPAEAPVADLKPGQISMKLEPATLDPPAGATDPVQGTHLVIRNGLDQPLRFHAAIAHIGQDGSATFEPTSTCPAMPKVIDIENWLHPVDALRIDRLRIAAPSDHACIN